MKLCKARKGRVVGVAALIALAGLASSAMAVDITPSSVYLWTGQDYGVGVGFVPGALNKPGNAGPTTWSWNQGNMSNAPQIDANGRIYFQGSFAATPQINTVSATNNTGIFNASNHTNVALNQAWATGQLDPTTGLPLVSNSGTVSGISTSSALRVSGTALSFGVQVGNPGAVPQTINENNGSGTVAAPFVVQNNMLMYVGTSASQTAARRTGAAVTTLPSNNNWTAAATNTGLGTDISAYRSFEATNSYGMNSSGTLLIRATLGTNAAAPNPATLPVTSGAAAVSGNNTFLGTVAGGSFNVIARAGDLPFGAGGPQFRSGSNGIGGFFSRINRSGQVAYDAGFFIPTGVGAPPNGGATAANDSTAWIHTPGAGTRSSLNSQFYQESLNVPATVDAVTGAVTSNGSSTYTGGISTGTRSFSNAGVLWIGATTGGDTTAGVNNSVLNISTAAGGLTPVWSTRRNDIAPGFTGASNVRLGAISTSNMAINNSGALAFASTLQGTVTAGVAPEFTTIFLPPFGLPTQAPPLITPGTMGNDTAIFTGLPGISGPTGLRAIARTGDAAPGFDGLFYNLSISSSNSANLNNAGDVLFRSSLVNTAAGTQYTGNGWQLAGGSSFVDQGGISDALFGYSAALGTVTPMLYVGQQIEVEPGIFKFITSFTVTTTDNGDGSSLGLNDNGQFVAALRLADIAGSTTPTSTSYVVLQIPAPGAGALALLGLTAISRRRRR